MNHTTVLAYSGGLDTSFCIPYLIHERKTEVHAVMVNTGGFTQDECKTAKDKALRLGAASCRIIDASRKFYEKGIKYMLFGDVLKNNTYPLSVSSERIFQVMEIIACARQTGATAIAHGCTGAGNDQIRFDFFLQVLAPEMEIIAPIRELQISRKEEIEYLGRKGFDFSREKSKYSINQGLWGTSIGGAETLVSMGELPDEAYPEPVSETGSEVLSITFVKGEPTAIDDKEMDPVSLIKTLNRRAAPYGIGRDIHVGDTLVGLKGRVGFEAPAALILIKAHHLIEKHVMSKWQLYWNGQLGNWYGMLLHEAQYLDPVMRNIEAFMESAQEHVSGRVKIRLRPRCFSPVGCESPYDRMQAAFGDYGEATAAFDGNDVRGFTKIMSIPAKIFHSLNKTDKS